MAEGGGLGRPAGFDLGALVRAVQVGVRSVALHAVLRERLSAEGAVGVRLDLRIVRAVGTERRGPQDGDQFVVQPFGGAGRELM